MYNTLRQIKKNEDIFEYQPNTHKLDKNPQLPFQK